MSVAGSWKLTMDTTYGVQTPLLAIKEENGAHSGTLTRATGGGGSRTAQGRGSDAEFHGDGQDADGKL